ncbi:hypothetical protein [Citromicrobium sp. JLT1363]|uniref:hypothetical protein n=1 Tax=Citromicrobium sp. JLT1363 TaxID=517722 RepID=UPI000225E519|nr:hypothetical protein [Citromicrobium sp. JLT1363]
MSIALCLVALAGTTFQCSADTATFSVFAPDEAETANYMGNVLTLYSVTGDGEILSSSARISQVFDDMPNSLYIEMKSDEATIEFEISEVDMAAATARAAVTGVLPSGEVTAVPASCTISTIAREDTDA